MIVQSLGLNLNKHRKTTMAFTVPTLLAQGALTKMTTVLVNISNNGTGGNRVAVNEPFTLGQIGLDPAKLGGAEPSFADAKAKMDAAMKGAGTPESRAAKAQGILAEYQASVKAHKASGGLPLIDRIAASVCNYLHAERGFSATGAGNKPKITPADLQVTAFNTPEGGVIFNVVGSSVWG